MTKKRVWLHEIERGGLACFSVLLCVKGTRTCPFTTPIDQYVHHMLMIILW